MAKIQVIPTTFVVALVVMVLAALLFWFWPQYDLSQVHPRLRSLKQPFRYVDTGYYLDGGSVGVYIIDGDGQELIVAFPCGWNSHDEPIYDRMFFGAMHCTFPNATEVQYSDDSKKYVVGIIAQYRSGDEADSALVALRGSPRDYLVIGGKRAFQKLTRSDERYR